MNYIRQINAFLEKRVGVLGAKEQAMYFSLLGIANQLRWPEWFTVSNAQLKREIMIKSTNTITETRNNLETNGFIKIIRSGNGKMLQYHLPMLYETSSKNEQVSEATSSKNEQVKNSTGSNFEQDQYKNCTGFGKTGSKNEHIINYINNKHIAAAAKEESQASKVFEIFQNNIHPISGEIEKDTLDDLIKDYGPKWVEEAIKEAALNNGRSVKYISVILERWSRDGFKAERRKANGTNERNHARRVAIVPANGWADAERRAEARDGWPED